jgi:hypothetical protein
VRNWVFRAQYTAKKKTSPPADAQALQRSNPSLPGAAAAKK